MFRVGQKIVCVDSRSGSGRWTDNDGPVEGSIYTVRRCFVDGDGDAILHLAEIARGPVARMRHGDNAGYSATRFRPIVERKTDISIFTKMLTPSDKKIGADA
jgi:hypothetical protein